jgi:hypothetical protein
VVPNPNPPCKFPLYPCLFEGAHRKTLQDLIESSSQRANGTAEFEIVDECSTNVYFHVCFASSFLPSSFDDLVLDLFYQRFKLHQSFSIQKFLSRCASQRLEFSYFEQFLKRFIPATVGFCISCSAPTAVPRSVADMCQTLMSEFSSSPDTLAVCLSACQNGPSLRRGQKRTRKKADSEHGGGAVGGGVAASGGDGEEGWTGHSEVLENCRVIESFIRSAARSIASGGWNTDEMQRFEVCHGVFLSNLDVHPRSQALYAALISFVGALKLVVEGELSSHIFNQVRVPLWVLDALFGPTVCCLLRYPSFTAHATFGIGWCDVKMASASVRMPPLAASVYLLIRTSPALSMNVQTLCEQLQVPESAIQSVLEFLFRGRIVRRDGDAVCIDQQSLDSSDPSVILALRFEAPSTDPARMLPVQHPKILRLMFEMLMLVDSAPVEEHVLVEHFLQAATDRYSIEDAATALQELRSHRVLKNDGALITRCDSNGQRGSKFTQWRHPKTTDVTDHLLLSAFVFVPDETIFASKDILPWAWTPKLWISKIDANNYFQQLIQDVSSVTARNFMAVAHALQRSLGSVARSMLLLLNDADDVQPCGENCQLMVSDGCGSSPVLKCPHCRGYCICLACLADLHTPGRRGGFVANAEQTDEPSTVRAFQYNKHSIEEFKWLYCCPHCGDLFPPSFWNHLTVLLSADVQSSMIEQMAAVVSRHVRYSEDPLRQPSMFGCRREGCDRFVSSSSRIQLVSSLSGVVRLFH